MAQTIPLIYDVDPVGFTGVGTSETASQRATYAGGGRMKVGLLRGARLDVTTATTGDVTLRIYAGDSAGAAEIAKHVFSVSGVQSYSHVGFGSVPFFEGCHVTLECSVAGLDAALTPYADCAVSKPCC